MNTAIRSLVTAALAALLSVALSGAAQAQEKSPSKGDVVAALEKRHDDEKVKCVDCHGTGKKTEPVALERCVKCHGDGDPARLAAKTANVKPLNPHQNRHYGVEGDCGQCHRIHEASVNFCLDCHPRFTFKVK